MKNEISFAASYVDNTPAGRKAILDAAQNARCRGFLTKITLVGSQYAVETVFAGNRRHATIKAVQS